MRVCMAWSLFFAPKSVRKLFTAFAIEFLPLSERTWDGTECIAMCRFRHIITCSAVVLGIGYAAGQCENGSYIVRMYLFPWAVSVIGPTISIAILFIGQSQ